MLFWERCAGHRKSPSAAGSVGTSRGGGGVGGVGINIGIVVGSNDEGLLIRVEKCLDSKFLKKLESLFRSNCCGSRCHQLCLVLGLQSSGLCGLCGGLCSFVWGEQ